MSLIEMVAVGFGIVAVYLNAKQNIWGWPTGLVNVGLYAGIFWHGQLYALMVLQLFYFAVSLYGWYHWLRGGRGSEALLVSRISGRLALGLAGLVAIASWGIGWWLDHYTSDAAPYVDSGISVLSTAAQWMMARKYLETWAVWMVVNLASVPLFLVRREFATAVQYVVFLGLAVVGWVQWKRSLVASS